MIDKSRIPLEANDVKEFVPPGWKVEEEVSGDLNGDSLADVALKLVEDKPAKRDNEFPNERQRALVIVLKNKAGKLSRAAVVGNLLQCTACGGAFYGVVEAPASVTIEKGVLVVEQDHGSRNVSDATYRFRYEPPTGKFVLIGLDVTDNDRLGGGTISESTNYLTGTKIIKRFRSSGRDTTSRKRIPRKKIYIEQVDHEKYEQIDN